MQNYLRLGCRTADPVSDECVEDSKSAYDRFREKPSDLVYVMCAKVQSSLL